MHPIKSLTEAITRRFSKKVFDPMENIDLNKVVGWRSMNGGTYHAYKRNDLENGYPSIRVITDNFALIEPYTLDKNGKKIASNVLDRIYTPNKQMSSFDFREALAVMALVHDKVHIRVHHKGTRVNADSITGFTFIEDAFETIVDGKRQYRLSNGEQLGDTEIITLKNINPYDVDAGFSAAHAARRWTKLDDYIADYQHGFFANGAVPAGEMIITARTPSEYNDIVDMLQAKHRGAGKNNNITYVHRPTDPNGAPLNAQIEWVPFSVANKDMALKDLFENVNKKIDSVYGVPASIRGVNDQNTYASVRTDEVVFIKYRLNPFALKIWSKFTHELNRITGGLGVAISYELIIPQIADEEKVRSESKNIDATTINLMVTQGFTLETVVDAFEFPESYKQLVKPVPVVEDKPEITDSEEIKNSPDQPLDPYGKGLKAKQLSEADRTKYEQDLSDVVRTRMTSQINRFIAQFGSKAISEDTPILPVENELLAKGMTDVLIGLIAVQGDIEHGLNAALLLDAGINIDNITPFTMTPAQKDLYDDYVLKVATGYNDETAQKIRNVISFGREHGHSVAEIKANLSSLIQEEYRIKRIAVSEVNRAGNESSLMSMKNIAGETGARVEKEWIHDGGDSPCEFCRAMIGTTVMLDDDFIGLNDEVTGADGGIFVNTFVPAQVAELHPNGHCRQVYRVVRGDVSRTFKKKEEAYKAKIADLKLKVKDLDGRTREAKQLNKELSEMKEYATQLEGLIDGQN